MTGLLRFVRGKPLGAAGGALVALLVFVALGAEVIAPFGPYERIPGALLQPPGPPYLMGTDNLGRDVLSRVVHGTRVSLYVGILAVAVGTTGGALLGLVSGYLGGKLDSGIQRGMEILMAFPAIVLAMTVSAMLGPTTTNVTLAIALTVIPMASRLLRSVTLSVKENQYIDAATAIGCSRPYIALRHILPNCLAPYIILATAGLGDAILVESALSFLGLGTPPPVPSWGAMLSGASKEFLEVAPWLAVFPGVAISLTVFGFNILGDALRDVLDPRLKGGK